MDSSSRPTRFNAPPCVPSNATTINNNQFLDLGFGANREALMMRNAGLQRQWEKERIREEIIAEEILRRRDLEMEVRRELAMEREFALRRAAVALSTSPVVGNGFDGRMPVLPAHTQVGNSGKLPFQRPDLGSGNAGKVVFLEKPTSNSNISVTNAKVYTVGDKKFIVPGTKKKLKEWGCALCKVSAPSEQALNEHLREKKHLENAAKLKGNKFAKKKSSITSWSEKKTYGTTTGKMNYGAPKSQSKWYCSLCQVSATREQDLNVHFRGKGHQAKEAELMAKKTTYNPTESCSIWQKKTDEPEAKPVTEDYKTLSNFWCHDCNVTCSSEIDLACHRKGKNHRAKEADLMSSKSTCSPTKSDAMWKKKTDISEAKLVTEDNKNHTNSWCLDCNANCNCEVDLASVQEGKSHEVKDADVISNISTDSSIKSYTIWRKKTDKLEVKQVTKSVDVKFNDFWCQHCNVTYGSEIDFASHLKGKKHLAQLEELKQNFATGTSDTAEEGEANKPESLDPTESLGHKPDESVTHEKSSKFPSLEVGGKLEELGKEDLKNKIIFWCEDCQLGLECEPAIASHLKGKKHMARLRAKQKIVATDSFNTNHNNGFSKTGNDSIERHEKPIGITDGGELDVVGEAKKGSELLDSTAKNEPVGEAIKTTNSSQVTSIKHEEKKESKLASEDYKKKFKFWCEDCQIGCTSKNLLDGHFKGKKHIAQLKALTQDFALVNPLGISGTAKRTESFEASKEEAMESVGSIASNPTDESIKHENSIGFLSPELEEKIEEKLELNKDLKKIFLFWCDDCQLGLQCEASIVTHLMGKKHMKHLMLRKEVVATDSTSSHDNSTGKMDDGSIGEGVKVLDSTVNNKSGEATKTSGRKTDEADKIADGSPVPSLEKDDKKEEKLKVEDSKKKFDLVKDDKKEEKPTVEDLKKKFEFWCEDCLIGCHSIVNMDSHLKGKKHMAQVRAKTEKCAGAAASVTTGKEDSSEEGFEEALDDFDGEQ